jgi:hypothetical protein
LKIFISIHRQCSLDVVHLEGEHPALLYNVHEVLRPSACMHVKISVYLPIMEGSHTCVTQPESSLGISLLHPGCRKPYPDRRDMCVSISIDALRSLGQNKQGMAENGQELSENRTQRIAVQVSRYGRSVSCDTHLGCDLLIVTKAPSDNSTGSQASSGGATLRHA